MFWARHIIVENNGRNFCGTFKEKNEPFQQKTYPPRIITSSHIRSRLNFNLRIRCFLHSTPSLQRSVMRYMISFKVPPSL